MPAPTPARPADRNLLFGILALQMDFIGRDALIAAMNTWVIDKAKTLGQILLHQGALRPDTHALLEALVHKHLEMHGHDPQRSLAALATRAVAQHVLGGIADEDVQASLDSVSASPDTDSPATGPYQPPTGATSDAIRYRILRPHAKGGLGEVFVALDQELHREVALKEILQAHAHEAHSRGRFLLEGEITGGLEHPGIVPVYGLGTYPDGRPFYAMRFIKGETFQAAIRRFHEADGSDRDPGERGLAWRQLLTRFVSICNAIAYAHSRGVIHRDIKPANAMLGDFGETLVVDWGLAKVVGQPEDQRGSGERTLRPQGGTDLATQMGAALGTPAYMSPEQAAGRLDQVGPASDVYSLGATLYCLLTGKAPVEDADVGRVLQRVQRGEFPQPRQVKRDVPAPMEAICLKAMALQPADRYVSARALAEDIEHWLGDEPVTAYREPVRVRLGRWTRRHKALVSGAGALLLTAVAALAVGLVLLGQEQERTEERRKEAVHEKERADGNAQAAAEQRGLALDTLKNVVFDIQEELKVRPGMGELQKKLLAKAQEGLQRVARSAETSAEVDHSMAHAHFQLGDIFLLLGETAKGNSLYEEGHRIAASLVQADPKNTQAQDDLATAYFRLGEVNMRLGNISAAQEAYRKARDIDAALAEADPQNAKVQRNLAIAYNKLGLVSLQLGNVPAAQEAFRKEQDFADALAQADPQNAQVQRDLTIAYAMLGDVHLRLGNAPAAQEAYRKSLDIADALAQADPKNAQAQRDLLVSYDRLGDATLQLGNVSAALEIYRKERDIAVALAQADPKNTEAQQDLALSYERLGEVTLRMGNVSAAQEAFRKCRDIAAALAQADPKNAKAQRNFFVSLVKAGNISLRLGNIANAQKEYQKCLDIAAALARADPKDAQAQRDLFVSYDKLGDISQRLGQAIAAREYFGKSLEISEKLAKADPQDVPAQIDVADITADRAGLEQEVFHYPEAVADYDRALAILRRLQKEGKLKDQPQVAQNIKALEKSLAVCRAAPRAMEDLAFALAQPAEVVGDLLTTRARALASRGQHAQAAATADKLRERAGKDAATLYQAACCFALCAGSFAPGQKADTLAAAEKTVRERYAVRALEVLGEAIRNGYHDVAQLKIDRDLESLRSRPAFQKLLADLEKPKAPTK